MSSTRDGYFASVEWTPNGWRLVCGGWPVITTLIVSDLTGATLVSQTVPGGALNFLRTAVSPSGVIAFVAQGVNNTMVKGLIQPDLTISAQSTTWPAFGQSGVNVAWLNDGFVYYGMHSGFYYYQVVNGVMSDPIRNPFTDGTSQGWIDVYDGNLRWIDQYRNDPAQQLLFPTSRGSVTMGQNAYNDFGDYVAGFQPNGTRFMAAPVLGQEITVAAHPGGQQWAWCARQEHGLVGFGLLPPFPAAPSQAPDEPPIDPPGDDPMPDLDRLLRDRSDLVKQLRQQLFGVDESVPLNSAEKAFRLTRQVAWELRAEGWGVVKAKAGSDNNVGGYTSDVIALADGEHVDVVSASGEHSGSAWIPARHQPGWAQSWNDAIRPRWEAPTDPGGVVVPPVDPPTDPPDDPDEPAGFELVLRAVLEERLTRLEDELGDDLGLLHKDLQAQREMLGEIIRLLGEIQQRPVTFPEYRATNRLLGTITFKPV